MAKEYAISYAGVTLGGSSSDYHIDGAYTFEQTGVEGGKMIGRVSCEVVIAKSPAYSEAQFATAVDALEVAFSKPRQDLTVVLGSATLISWSHSSNTGFNARPRCEKIGSPEDTARSRRYRVSVEVDLPADLSGQNGRRDSRVEVHYDPSRIRTVTITGHYTALSGSSARAQYESASPAYFSSIISGLTGGGTFEIIEEQVNNDDANKLAEFRIVYREIIYNQTSGGADSTTIVRHTVTFAKVQPSTETYMKNNRALATIVATYAAHVNKTVSTDLENLWSGTLRNYVIAQFDSIFNATAKGIRTENLSIDKTNNTINCSLEFVAVMRNSDDFLEVSITEAFDETTGFVFTGSYAGNPVGMHVDVGWHTILRITDRRDLVRGKKDVAQTIRPASSVPSASGNWYQVSAKSSGRSFYLGIPGDPQIQVTEFRYLLVDQYVEKPKAAAVTTPGEPAPTPSKPPPVTTPSA